MTKSKKTIDVENASKTWLRNGNKNNNTSSNMHLDHCCLFSLLTYFCPALDMPLGRSGGNMCMCGAMNTSSLVSSKSLKRFCSKGRQCVPIYIHALVQPPPPPHFHPSKFIKKRSLKFFKHLSLLYKHSSHLKTWKLHKIDVDETLYCIKI